ncbi:MAG: WecB/TagA/CpsF family glycosyltransferase [Cognatishimia sp.]
MQFQSIDAFSQGARPIITPKRIRVMKTDLVNARRDHAVDAILAPGRRSVFFLNAHCANIAAKDPHYAAALSRADMVLPDGIGIKLATRLSGQTLVENLNGTDLVPDLMHRAADQGLRVFLLGGKPGTAEAAARGICAKVPGLQIAGTRDGYEGARNQTAAIEEINQSGADILLVAMGVPLQENWIDTHFEALAPRIALAVGGLFDFWAGNVKRAPKLIRKAQMEWAWRLAMEPRRMAKRYLVGNCTFMLRAALSAYKTASKFAAIKRLIDVALSAAALTVLGPIFLALMLAIRAESRGPALFKQVRVGRNGETFTLYKLRSMYIDAEARRAALLATSDRKGICFKSKHDPRVTRIGRFIRRYSLDELPQILNVLKGEMSIVGPRPALPEEVAAYPLRALGRLDAKPGLTGLWQVSGRADIGFDQMVDMDLAYSKSQSLLLDLMLISLTFRAIWSGRGAY